jgi:hypothetical protein
MSTRAITTSAIATVGPTHDAVVDMALKITPLA